MAADRYFESLWNGAEPGWPVRPLLGAASGLYACGRALHRALYRTGLRRRVRLSAVVVSIGNLAVGGVGKTPFTAWLASELTARGATVMVLGRGYRRARGAALNDEGRWLAQRQPQVRVVQDPDRARAARAALALAPCDFVLLDDGFQHERLERDVDVVLVDAGSPFGNGRLLPAGPLRESPAALARADWLVATRCEQVEASTLAEARSAILRQAPRARFAALYFTIAAVRVGGVRHAPTLLAGRAVVLCTGVGDPGSVRRTLKALGANVVADQLHPDHHRFVAADLAAATQLAARHEAQVVVTAKDAVKLDELAVDGAPRYAVLEQEVDRVDGGAPLLEELWHRRDAARVSSSSR